MKAKAKAPAVLCAECSALVPARKVRQCEIEDVYCLWCEERAARSCADCSQLFWVQDESDKSCEDCCEEAAEIRARAEARERHLLIEDGRGDYERGEQIERARMQVQP